MTLKEIKDQPVFKSQFDAELEWAKRKGIYRKVSFQDVTRLIQEAYVNREIIKTLGGWIVTIEG